MEPTRCECGRPKWTTADLKRWQEEQDEWVGAGKPIRGFNPDWAKPICWYSGPEDRSCGMRPLQ